MTKKNKLFAVFFISALILFQGCAYTVDEPLAINDLQAIPTIKVVRCESPPLLRATAGTRAVAGASTLLGFFGHGIHQGALEASGKKLNEKCNLPDFNELVMNKFVERVPKELLDFPTIEIEDKPVEECFLRDSGYIIMLSADQIKLENESGLYTFTTAQLRHKKHNILWQKQFIYESIKFDRCSNLEKLEAKNCILLHEEIDFAVEKIVSAYINHLKGY